MYVDPVSPLVLRRLYEGIQPLKIESENLRTQRDKLSADIAQLSNNLHSCEQDLLEVSANLAFHRA